MRTVLVKEAGQNGSYCVFASGPLDPRQVPWNPRAGPSPDRTPRAPKLMQSLRINIESFCPLVFLGMQSMRSAVVALLAVVAVVVALVLLSPSRGATYFCWVLTSAVSSF